jgi:glycosyltransferase involved in cell wall biosynthesis
LIVLVVFHVEHDSGPQRSLAPRLARLAADGARVASLFPAPGPAAERARALGEVLTRGPRPLLFPTGPLAAARLPATLRVQARATEEAALRTGADVVIVTSPTLLGAIEGAARAGAGTLLYGGELLARGGLRGLAGARITRAAGGRADAVVVPSQAVADSYRAAGAEPAIVHPPIEAPPHPETLGRRGAELRARLGIDMSDVVVSSLGAITAGRGQDLLVEAVAGSSGPPAHLIIGGAPYDRPRDREFARRLERTIASSAIADRVHLAGRIDDPHALYAASDLFVNPARVPEGFGRAACEALTVGCPVVSTNGGGAAEALRDGETALLVAPDSAEALRAAIERVLESPDLGRRLASAGREDIVSRFTPAAGEKEFSSAVDRAASARSRSPRGRGP